MKPSTMAETLPVHDDLVQRVFYAPTLDLVWLTESPSTQRWRATPGSSSFYRIPPGRSTQDAKSALVGVVLRSCDGAPEEVAVLLD